MLAFLSVFSSCNTFVVLQPVCYLSLSLSLCNLSFPPPPPLPNCRSVPFLSRFISSRGTQGKLLDMALFYAVPPWLLPVCLLLFFSWIGW